MDIKKVAHLARLALTEEESARYQTQIEKILGYVEQLQQIDVDGIEPTAHAAPVFDTYREDELHEDTLSTEAVLSNAPATAHGQIKMPKVID
ncbi:MAG: Asp-tRNA(Asn)/Glu-tRNA(Gln) amidotransferase subunit GatC [Verrucomicrobiota bacterium]